MNNLYNFGAKIDAIVENVRSPKILSQYGKVLTGEKKFAKALTVNFLLLT